jgi:CHAT domain-containing protein
VTGQGVLGLQASLTAAGARGLLMSLWKVPDASTAALMEQFYRGLWEGDLAPAAALRQAQAAVRATPGWGAPVHWAAWVLSGDAFRAGR